MSRFSEVERWLAGLHPEALAAVRLEVRAGETSVPPSGDESVFWDAPLAAGLREIVSAQGTVVRVDATGPSRFGDVVERGEALLGRIAVFGGARPRLFGGFAFEPEHLDADWASFGDASFTLPEVIRDHTPDGELITIIGKAGLLRTRISPDRPGADRPRPASHDGPSPRPDVDPDSDAEFSDLVARGIDLIDRGEIEKVVLARRTRVHARGTFLRWESVLSRLAGGPQTTRFCFVRDHRAFIGATPETLVRLRGRGLTTEAVAGTIPRLGDDSGEIGALLGSDKERREHELVRRTILSGLGPHVTALRAAETPEVRTLASVHHLVSPIAATATPGAHVARIAGALHPTPAVAGWPTDAATGFIRSNERWSRGWYASPVGWFDGAGDGAFVVGIRSALIDETGAWVYAGAGIVRGSRPDRESLETRAKQAPMLAALTGAA